MRQMRKNREGFTLVELIVVLVLLAILAAILVPALLGWIDKAREKKDLLEARNVVQATQVLATEEYAASTFKGDGAEFIKNHEAEILVIADGKGKIESIGFPLNSEKLRSPILEKLTYITADGTYIRYDRTGNPVYTIGGEGSNSQKPGAPSYTVSWKEIFESAIKNGGLSDTGGNQPTTGNMTNLVKEANGGTLPTPTEAEKKMLAASGNIKGFGTDSLNSLVWTPLEVNSANNLDIDGRGYVMALCPPPGEKPNNNASIIYYGGEYYVCVEHHSYQGLRFSASSTQKEFDVSTLNPNTTLDNYDFDQLSPGQKVWLRYES